MPDDKDDKDSKSLEESMKDVEEQIQYAEREPAEWQAYSDKVDEINEELSEDGEEM